MCARTHTAVQAREKHNRTACDRLNVQTCTTLTLPRTFFIGQKGAVEVLPRLSKIVHATSERQGFGGGDGIPSKSGAITPEFVALEECP